MSAAPPLAGVIGDPVGHSLSPRLHGHWLSRLGLRGAYVALPVGAADLAEVLHALPRMGFHGANVTIPHKEAALALAHEATPAALAIGAANTLVFSPEGRIAADNTDAHGFIANLREGAPSWAPGRPALVLGAGGAARAVLHALREAGVAEIFLANRTEARAEALAHAMGPGITPIAWEALGGPLQDAGLLVNTTALGMTGQAALSLPWEALSPATVVSDLVYAPLETPLLARARARGCVAVDGLGMLLQQAAPGFARWFGAAPPVDAEARAAVLAGAAP